MIREIHWGDNHPGCRSRSVQLDGDSGHRDVYPDGNKQYSTYNPDGSRGTMNMASFPMPYATIVDFSRPMNCSKTKVLGIHGTIKEVYGLDDWKINIRGFCIADKSREGYKTVAEQVNALCKFRKVTEAIGVTGSIFNNKEIYSIIIDNISFNPIQETAA